MSDLKRIAENNAIRVNAYLRVSLRKWLRNNCSDLKYPEHLWLDYDIPKLTEAVTNLGGDVDALLENARQEITDRIFDGT